MSRSFSGAANDKIATALTSNADLRTYSIWAYRIGAGGGSLGRIFQKGTSGTTLALTNNNAGATYDFNRSWTSAGNWTVPQPPTNVWTHILITYDSSSASNDPAIYIDAILQTTTETQTPSGTRTDNAEVHNLGNRGDTNNRNWDGYLAEWAVWDRILDFSEILGLTNGNPPWKYPNALASYISLREASLTDFMLSAPTATGTTEAPDPPIRRAFEINNLRPRIFAPGRAR